MVDSEFLLVVGVYFFLMLLVAQGISLIVGYGRLHFLGYSIPFLVGGFTVSSFTCRLAYFVAEVNGVSLFPWHSQISWVNNSQVNAEVVNEFFVSQPIWAVGLILFSLTVAFFLGGLITWVTARPAQGLSSEYLAIISYTAIDLFAVIGRVFIPLSGGTMGVFVPNVFVFLEYDKNLIFFFVSGFAALGVTMGLRKFYETGIRLGPIFTRKVLFFGGGAISLAGCLLSFYFLFVVQASYNQAFWGWWPLLMVVLAGFDRGWRLFAGVFVVHLFRYLVIVFRSAVVEFLFFPVAYLESGLLGVFLILGLMLGCRNSTKKQV